MIINIARNIFKPKNLKKDKPPTQLVERVGQMPFIKWGDTNNFPFTLIETVRQSTTGKACANTFSQYVYGNGFNDKDIAKILDGTLQKTSGQLVRLGGFALCVKFNGALEMVSAEAMDFENIRLGLPNENGVVEYVVYNPYMGSNADYRSSDNQVFPIYDFDKTKLPYLIEKYGSTPFVVWFGVDSEYARFYPLPFFWGDSNSQGGGL